MRVAAIALFFVAPLHAATITGTIYCDNYFEFYFNGLLIKKDPLTFTPHNAVFVSFEHDGVSDKTYAIMCQDFATDSGYEYTSSKKPGLGDGALIAEFDDGTITTSQWKSFVATEGPTDASITAGCSATALDKCVVQENVVPADWFSAAFNDALWATATTYTAEAAGWGRTPSWTNEQCCTPTSPMDREDLSGCNKNYNMVTQQEENVLVTANECLDPQVKFASTQAKFIWGSELQKHNQMLFRWTLKAGQTLSPTATPATGPPTATAFSSSSRLAAHNLLAALLVAVCMAARW